MIFFELAQNISCTTSGYNAKTMEKGKTCSGKSGGKKDEKKAIKKKQRTLFGIAGYNVSVNKVDKKKKVNSTFVRKDLSVREDEDLSPKFVKISSVGGYKKHFLHHKDLEGIRNGEQYCFFHVSL